MKTLIVANDKRQADLIAKEHNLKPWQWRYVFTYRDLLGISGRTILVAANWAETPMIRMKQRPLQPPVPQYQWPMTETLQQLSRFSNCEIIKVST